MELLRQISASVLALISALGFNIAPANDINFGAYSVPISPALVDTFLASNISSSDTSLTLADGTTRGGTALSGFMCFVIDVNQPNVEYVCGTASSTSVTSLMRGVDVLNPNATSSALASSHRRFASVQVSDYPTLQFLVRKMNGTDSIPNVLTYDTSVSTTTIYTNGKNLVDYETLTDVVATGCGNASETGRGCVEIATQAELAAGTSVGGTGARNVAPATYFNATSSATTTVPVTNSAGKLSTGFIDQTASYSWSGTHTFSATTTISGPLIFSGTSSQPVVRVYTVSATTTTATSTWTKPSNLRYVKIRVQGAGGGSAGANADSEASGGGGGGGYCEKTIMAASLGSTETVTVGGAGAAGSVSGAGGNASSSSFGSHCTGGGGGGSATADTSSNRPGGTSGTATGGDINIPGEAGGYGMGGISATKALGGYGGSSYMGFGGPQTGDNGATSATIHVGTGYGAGAGGSADEGGSDEDGATGTPGIVIVEEYFI